MKGSFFEFLHQYELFKSWNEAKIKELLAGLPEDTLMAGPSKPANSTLLIRLIDRWNYNFFQFKEIMKNTEYEKYIQLCWLTPKRNIDNSIKEYFLCIDKSIVNKIEEKYPNLIIVNHKSSKQYKSDIKYFKKIGEEIFKYLANFYSGGFLFSQYDFYMQLASFSFIKNIINAGNSLTLFKDETLKLIESELHKDGISPMKRDRLKDMVRFIEDKYNEIVDMRNDYLSFQNGKLNIPDKYKGLPALVLRMRGEGKSDCEIIREIYRMNSQNAKNKDGQITNPMLGVLLYEGNGSSDWKQVGKNAKQKCNDEGE